MRYGGQIRFRKSWGLAKAIKLRFGSFLASWVFTAAFLLGQSISPDLSSVPDTYLRAEWPDRALFPRGRYVFQKHCVVCHGVFGRGDGEMTPGMIPKPRDLTQGIFKFRSTPSGYLPTTEDLRRTVRQGLSGSAMPSFAALPERDLEAVLAYVKSLSVRWWRPENYSLPISIPPVPTWLKQGDDADRSRHLRDGSEVYRAACSSCHGESGQGLGVRAASWLEVREEAWPPPDLTQPLRRAGPGREDVFRTLLTGLDGTPMPSFRDTLTEEQCWEVVAVLEQFREIAAGKEAH